MNRYLERLGDRAKQQVQGALFRIEQSDNRWVLKDIETYFLPVFLLIMTFFHEDDAIGIFARQNGWADKPLAEIEAQWLLSENGALRFRYHYRRFFNTIRTKFPPEIWSLARLYAQIILINDDTHWFLVSRGMNHDPTEAELQGEAKFLSRLSLRLYVLIYSPEDFQRALEDELKKEKTLY